MMSERPRKQSVFILVGPKGSGKTYIGALLERRFSINFFRAEAFLLENYGKAELASRQLEKHGFPLEEAAIDQILANESAVIYEVTGSSEYFPEVLRNLRSKYEVKLVRIRCPLGSCYDRVKQRDQTDQIPVSDTAVKTINEKAAKATFAWDLEIDNSGPASNETIVSLFRTLL